MAGDSDQPIIRCRTANTAPTGEGERYDTADGRTWQAVSFRPDDRTGLTIGKRIGWTIREERR